jgi:dTDP-4-dehydrorhamnose reductase
MIYNPFFAEHRINAVVVPMGVVADDYPQVLRSLARLTNFHGVRYTAKFGQHIVSWRIHNSTTMFLGERGHKLAIGL